MSGAGNGSRHGDESRSGETPGSMTRLSLPRLYAILDVDRLAGRSVESVCEAFFNAGVRLLQYRNKRASARQLFEGVWRLMPMIRVAGASLIVNDRADVALVAGADGV